MSDPWVGDLLKTGETGCAYSPTPADPMCGKPVTRHVAAYSHPWEQIVGLPTCDDHEPIARVSARFYRAHDWDEATCGQAGARWLFEDDTRCVPLAKKENA